MTITNRYGVIIDFDAAAHLDKFGQPWELDKPNPVY